MRIISYTVINLLLFSSWYIFLFKERTSLSFIDRLIGAFTLGLAQIIATEMLLGILFKKLFAMPLFWVNISLSLVVLVLATYTLPLAPSRRGRGGQEDDSPIKGRETTNTFPLPLRERDRACPVLDTGVRGKDILYEFRDKTVGIFRIIKKDRVLFLIFNLFLISVCYMVFIGYLFPSYTWDALWYHLPIVGYIVQSGAIQENITPSLIDLFINIFPKNIELFLIWNIIFLKNDVIVDLSQLLFTIMGIFTIFSIAVKSGLKEEYAVYSSFLFFFAPVVILQSTTNYIDIAVSVLFLIAINFLMHDDMYSSDKNVVPARNKKMPILLSGLATGILVGSKGSGPIFAVVLSTMVILKGFIKYMGMVRSLPHPPIPPLLRGGKRGVRGDFRDKNSLILYVVYFMVPAILIGGYWYIKNWVVYGNPVYPMEVSLFKIKLFKGLFEGIIDPLPDVLSKLSLLGKLVYVWQENVQFYLYDSRLSGFGPLWFILFLPSIVIAFFYAVKNKKYNFLFISAILVVTFIIYPRNWYTRYVIFILCLGNLSFGFTLNYFETRQRIIKPIALLLVIYTFLFSNSPCVMPVKIREFLRLPSQERVIARLAPFNIDLQARQDYGLWLWINDNMLDGNVLAYTFEPLFLAPLWNKGFTNKIVYTKHKDFNEWVKSLKNNQVTHVLIKQDSVEDKWIKEMSNSGISSERFNAIYSDENYKVLSFGY